MQIYPLKLLVPNETKELTLDLLKSTDITDPHTKKSRGQIVLELRYAPFREDSVLFSGPLDRFNRKASRTDSASSNESYSGAGLLMVTVYGAEDVEGSRHNNPYVLIIFRGEKRKSKVSTVKFFLSAKSVMLINLFDASMKNMSRLYLILYFSHFLCFFKFLGYAHFCFLEKVQKS